MDTNIRQNGSIALQWENKLGHQGEHSDNTNQNHQATQFHDTAMEKN